MNYETKVISDEQCDYILSLREGYFLDFKSRNITPAKITRTLSAFCNAAGGEVYIGIGETGKAFEWDGFEVEEDANGFCQVFRELDSLENIFLIEFLKNKNKKGLILHIVAPRSKDVIQATDGKIYKRVNASNIPLMKQDEISRLKFDKGIQSYEDELLNIDLDEICNSEKVIGFFLETIPEAEPEVWLRKQFLILKDRPTVASTLLFSDNPQNILAKRSAIKIIRYQTTGEAERDFLSFTPITMEGAIYDLIYNSVARVKEEIEKIEKIESGRTKKVSYPGEALHEIVTNAVLHRDYSIASDIQIRIFDNKVEVESPGRLPGHVTVDNIKDAQFARNPKIVRLINKFDNPPNKDVGEGVNTVFSSMEKRKLRPPVFEEMSNSLLVTLKHESLDSPNIIVMNYLKENDVITNGIARRLTGIKSENTMKRVFYDLKKEGVLERVEENGKVKNSWKKVDSNFI